MESALNKSERLAQLEQLLIAHPQGLKRADIARRLGVNRSTVGRYIDELSARHDAPIPIYDDEGVIKINRDKYLNYIGLTVHEAMAVHLATRLMATRTDKHNRHAAAALRKLGQALETFAPLISRHVQASANVMDDGARRQDANYLRTLEILTRAWSDRQMVHIWHRYQDNDDVNEYDFAPYFIEPYAIGQTTHVIGRRIPPDAIRTFKVERIERIELLPKAYIIPPDFNPQARLADAWGIWYTDDEPETVALKFQPRVAGRVKETQWHRSETVTGQPDGSLIWQAKIAEPREMLPWIRGWGADVEVLEPGWLREEVKGHVWEMVQNYKLTTQHTDVESRLLRLWGKTTKDPQLFHPALYHMFDVAHVARQLLSPRASNRWRQVLANALNADAATLNEWLPYLIALHDLGKISVPFQILNDKQRQRLQSEGFIFGKATPANGKELHHTIVGRMALKEFQEFAGWSQNLLAAFTEMISGHHGVFQRDESEDRRNFKLLKEAEEWAQLRQQTARILQSYFLLQLPNPLPNPADQSVAMVTLNGFCILCDWLGSDEAYFAPAPFTPISEYISQSRKQACRRVKDAGFFHPAVSTAPSRFAPLFGIDPRPLQAAIDDIPDSLLALPTLTIIEAPTGEGKTEAALTLARRIGALRGDDEMYIALPTTATSNAMFDRIQEYLEKRLGLSKELMRLVHGQDFLKDDDLPVNPMESVELTGADPLPSLAWFAPKKKALLAPFGVGTIDQAELTTLNVRHNTLRMIGLAGKTVILDEVHAYDTYMTTIIKRMLTWLSALGTSVILLSATLPTARRRELAQAFAGNAAPSDIQLEAYPNILTINQQTHHFATPKPVQMDRTIALHTAQFSDDDAAAKAQWLIDQTQTGGCACWITNTVKRAQQIFGILLENAPADVDLQLLHARLPLLTREAREKAIFSNYGPNGNRPARGIVVGTQVLEQSLDLDFDVMMTDLAPVDLILQRAGRLHRHPRDPMVRGSHLTPHLYLNTVITNADAKIYAEYVLQKTLQIIEPKTTLTLPNDYRPLIEAVYHNLDKAPVATDPLYEVWKKLNKKQGNLESEAKQRLMNPPEPDEPFYLGGKIQGLTEDEESNSWLNGKTRWAEQESITIIPLLKTGDSTTTTDGDVTAPLDSAASRNDQLKLLRHGLRISHQTLIRHLKNQSDRGKLFANSTLLKNVYPLWLQPNTEPGVFIGVDLPVAVQLHPQLGLVIGDL
jgi:CRISPR-associated endonuclease/helicase Cas3